MCATNRAIPRVWNPHIPMEEMRTPAAVKKAAEKKASTKSIVWLVWLQEYDGTLMARVFAAKKYRMTINYGSCRAKYGLQLFEVMREVIGDNMMIIRNIWLNPCGGWCCWFPAENEIIDCDWRTEHTDKRPGVWMQLVNPEAVTKCERFRFCGWRPDTGVPLCSYLNAWLENHGVEYFGKIGLIPKKSLVKKATKDGNFRKWLRTLSPEQISQANIYGPNATLLAYKHKRSISEAYSKALERRQLQNRMRYYAAPIMKWHSAEKIEAYLTEQCAGHEQSIGASYRDYIDACAYLGLDLKDTKVVFPRDFDRMHDMRIDQMHSKQAKEDRKARRQLCEDFKKAAEAVKRFEKKTAAFCIIIPTKPAELVTEGARLQHCVGKMGYDKKMAEGRDFIAFLRKADAIGKPFVTLEYNLKNQRLQQCYGERDSRPAPEVQAFAEAWAEKVTETLKEEERERKRAEAAAAEEEERQRLIRNRREALA